MNILRTEPNFSANKKFLNLCLRWHIFEKLSLLIFWLVILCKINAWVRLHYFELLFDNLAVEIFKKTYKQLNHFIFGGINCLSFAITPSLDSCERVVRSFFAVLLCIMSISWFLAWHMYDSQHDWNSSASPRENSTNMGDEQGIYLIHQEQPLHEKCRNKEFFMLRIFQY